MAPSRGRPLPVAVAERYPALPDDVVAFLSSIEICRNENETVWFLTASDYDRDSTTAFRWNELEIMAIDTAAGNSALVREATRFWDRHFPFMLAVHSDYNYLPVRLDDGSVIHGSAPEWEQPSVVCQTFPEFLRELEAQALGVASFPLKLFLDAG